MTFHPADNLSLSLYGVFAALMMVAVTYGVWRGQYKFKTFMVIFISYLALYSAVIQSGLAIRFVIPAFPLLFFSVLAFATVFAFSAYGRHISDHFSLAALIGFQGFRLPLELLLHHWVSLKTVPPTMTWTGQNWDIAAGLISLLAIPFVNKNSKIAWAVQWIGFLLLLNVLRVVILSSPFPFSWPLENPIQLIGYMPYALIGPLFVGVALALHLIVFRKLSRKSADAIANALE